MLYASMALVAAGVVLLLYSLFFENEITRSRPPSDRYVPPMDEVKSTGHDADLHAGGISEELKDEFDDFTMIDHEDLLGDEDLLDVDMYEVEDIHVDNNENSADTVTEHPVSNVILYEDPERISVEGVEHDADINAEDVSRFTRVGEGTIEVFQDGINLRVDKRLYRFDFNKIDRVYAGKNYIVLTLKSVDAARVILFRDSNRVPDNLISQLDNLITTGI
ncbi:MAG TPA: hypothetical protein VKQ10_00530 [Spirochaetota bacterium]|nr:hypothetical protein [Spirochaetota bacterium]